MSQNYDATQLKEKISQLTQLLNQQDEEVRQLKEALLPTDWEPPVELNLTGMESRILGCLYKKGTLPAKKDHIFFVVYQDKLEQPEMKVIDVLVCKMRKKLKQYGVNINTVWGSGYSLDQASYDILKSWGVYDTDATKSVSALN